MLSCRDYLQSPDFYGLIITTPRNSMTKSSSIQFPLSWLSRCGLLHLLIFSLGLLCQAQSSVDRTNNCEPGILDNRTCGGTGCPKNVTSLGHADLLFNVSAAGLRVAFDTRSSVIDQMSISLLDSHNYARLLAGQSYATFYDSYNRRGWCATVTPIDVDTHGRGFAVVFWCRNTLYNCTAWYDADLVNVVEECSENCTTGSVGDGICNPLCNTANCDFDGGDCRPVTVSSSDTQTNQLSQCWPGCYGFMLGDGACQSNCDVPACAYDSGDCLAINNPCADNPCQNGGQCSQIDDHSYRCQCSSDLYCGTNCSGTFTNNTNPRTDNVYCSTSYESCSIDYSHFAFCCDGTTSKCIENLGAMSSGQRPSLF